VRSGRRGRSEPGRLTRALLPGIVLSSAAGYALTAPRWILGGDNGEFSTMYATGGIAHPPGYASMVIWLRLWHWLPVDTPAHGAALATVVLGAMAVFAVQRACLAWGASTAATAFVSAVYAFSPVAWKMSCHAEVFAMNAMFAGAILALSAPEPPLRDWKLTLALGLLAGLAIEDQQSIVFLAPIGLLAAVRAVREAKRPWVAALSGVLALVLGLLPGCIYMYVVATTSDPRTTPMWIEAPNLAGVFFHLRRGAYGTLSLAGIAVKSDPARNLWLFAKNATRQMLGMPFVVLLAVGLVFVRRELWKIERRRLVSLALLFAAFLLAGPAFIARFNLPFVGAAPTVAERFYLFPEVILTVMGALALDALLPWLVVRERLMAALTAQAAIAASLFAVPEVLEHNRPSVELYVENTLRGAPEGAILVGTGDHRWGGFLYARYALHQRPDVFYVNTGTLVQAWDRRLVESMTGVPVETPAGKAVGPKTLLARLLATGRPVLYADWPDPTVEATPHASVGTLMRVLREGESAPAPDELDALNVEVFAKYEMESSPPEDEHGWGYALQGDYARPWLELARAYGKAGNAEKEQECLARAAELAPWTVKIHPPPTL
jgi:hypothetical protein